MNEKAPHDGPQADDTANSSTSRSSSGAELARAALEAARARAQQAGKRRGNKTDAGDGARRLKRRRWSGPGIDRARDPQLIGDTIKSWLKAAAPGGEIVKAQLFNQWAAVVGQSIADHAVPVSLVDGELTIQAESTAWATQLRLLAPGLVKTLNTTYGHGTVRHIKTTGPAAPSWRFGSRHIPGRGPRDTYG